MSCHKETQWNGFAVISIALCPGWKLLKAPPHLEGEFSAAAQFRSSQQDLAPGSCSLSASGLKKIILLLGEARPWREGKEHKEDCSAPLRAEV